MNPRIRRYEEQREARKGKNVDVFSTFLCVSNLRVKGFLHLQCHHSAILSMVCTLAGLQVTSPEVAKRKFLPMNSHSTHKI